MIHVDFGGWDEVLRFARQVLGMEGKAAQPQAALTPVSQPIPQPVPEPVQQPVPAPVSAPSAVPQATTPVTQPMPVTQPAPVTQPQPVPTATATYTLDDLARAAMPLMDAGRQADLQQLLKLFGVEALPALQPGQYGAFATKLREMGAQI